MTFRLLLLALIVGIIALCWKYVDYQKSDIPFQADLISLNRDTINAIEIHRLNTNDTLLIKREGDQWLGSLRANSFLIWNELADSLLTPIDKISSKGLYEMPASFNGFDEAIELRFFSHGQELEAFTISESEDGSTLLQFKGQSEVFELKESIWAFYDRPINSYRIDDFISFNPKEVVELGFSFNPNVFTTLKKDSLGWKEGIDKSSWVEKWLKGIQNLKGQNFADQFDPIASSALLSCSIDIRFDEIETPLQIFVYRDSSGISDFVLNSSQYPTHFFWSDSTGLYQKVVPLTFRERETPNPE